MKHDYVFDWLVGLYQELLGNFLEISRNDDGTEARQ